MSIFTLAISCLTTFYLPWFMNLTFQVPMQYYSLQHWILLPSPSHAELGIVFLLIPSLHSLELFLHSSPVAYWATTDLGSTVTHKCGLFYNFGLLQSHIHWPAFWPQKTSPCYINECRNQNCFKSVGEGRVGWCERIELKHIYYHRWNRWPV